MKGWPRPGLACVSALALASVAPRTCRACTVFELSEAGFAANVFALLHAFTIHDGINGTFYVDSSNFNYKCTGEGGLHDVMAWDERMVPWSAEKERAAGEACSRQSLATIEGVVYGKVEYAGGPEALGLVAVQRAWKYRPWVQEIIDKRLAKLADRPGPTIGFHIRGGDMLQLDRALNRATTTPHNYITTFVSTFPKVKGGTCVMLGDDHAKITEAAKLAEKLIHCKVMRGPAKQGSEKKEGFVMTQEHFNQLDLEAKCSATAQILVDMELLAHTDYYVASEHSKWARVVGYLRYGLYRKAKSTYVDASAGHVDLYSILRRYVATENAKVKAAGGLQPKPRKPDEGLEEGGWDPDLDGDAD